MTQKNCRKPVVQLWAEKENGLFDTIISEEFLKAVTITVMVVGFGSAFFMWVFSQL